MKKLLHDPVSVVEIRHEWLIPPGKPQPNKITIVRCSGLRGYWRYNIWVLIFDQEILLLFISVMLSGIAIAAIDTVIATIITSAIVLLW